MSFIWDKDSVQKLSLFIYPILYACIVIFFFVDTRSFVLISFEDRWVEWLTALFLLGASMLAFIRFVEFWRKQRRFHWFFAAFAAIVMLLFLEEISFGQRIFGLETPKLMQQRSDQKEFNLHNLFQGMARERLDPFHMHYFKTKTVAQLGAFAYGIFLPILIAAGIGRQFFQKIRLVVPPIHLVPGFVLAAILLGDRPTGQEEEYGELFLSSCFFLHMWTEKLTPVASTEKSIATPGPFLKIQLMVKELKNRVNISYILYGCAALFAGHLLYSAFCAFTSYRFFLYDYTVYTNMIWNSGHGDWFRVLVNSHYLVHHLSFSLALLGLLFHIWDHPFLLAVVQWSMLMGGGFILHAILRRSQIRPAMRAAFLIFLFGYTFTQRSMLSEFHGIAAYFLLVPWLYYCLVYRKGWAWLPLLLILGVREDAFIFTLPILLYFAVRDRWRSGYVLAGLALAYGLIAIFILYPEINGLTIFQRRVKGLGQFGSSAYLNAESLLRRGHATLWTLLPCLIFWFRTRCPWPALILPSAAFFSCMASGVWQQQGLYNHYPATVMITLAAGIVEVLRNSSPLSPAKRVDGNLQVTLLVGITIIFHVLYGFLWGGRNTADWYQKINPSGLRVLGLIDQVPKKGLLIVDGQYAAFLGNRADIHSARRYRDSLDEIDILFMQWRNLPDRFDGKLTPLLEAGELGVSYLDGSNFIAIRGHDPAKNKKLITALNHSKNLFYVTRSPTAGGGESVYTPGSVCPVRYWNGNGSKAPINLSFGFNVELEAGPYYAIFRYKAVPPKRKVRDSWGWFSLHYLSEDDAITKEEIRPHPDHAKAFTQQAVFFETDGLRQVEFRITGADAELYLESVLFLPQDAARPFL